MSIQKSEWETVADEFVESWDFPKCIAAINGKHIVIKRTINSGSYYLN